MLFTEKNTRIRDSWKHDGFLVVYSDQALLQNEYKNTIDTVKIDATKFLSSLQENGGRIFTYRHIVEVQKILEGFGVGKTFYPKIFIQNLGKIFEKEPTARCYFRPAAKQVQPGAEVVAPSNDEQVAIILDSDEIQPTKESPIRATHSTQVDAFSKEVAEKLPFVTQQIRMFLCFWSK